MQYELAAGLLEGGWLQCTPGGKYIAARPRSVPRKEHNNALKTEKTKNIKTVIKFFDVSRVTQKYKLKNYIFLLV